MTALDLLLIALLIFAGISGYRRGFSLQLLTLTGLGVGLLVGAMLAPRIAARANGTAIQAGLAIGTLLVFAGLGDAAGWFIGTRLRNRARQVRLLGRFDAAGGSALSIGATLIVVWFIALNLVNGPFPQIAREIRGSFVVRTLGAALPTPPPIVGEIRRFLGAFDFPDVFVGLPPAPAGAVPPPTDAQVREAQQAASGSVVEITGEACGNVLEGSGFIAAPGYVVTNAHVVAGGTNTEIHEGGRTTTATVVLFDPKLDIAVLRTTGLSGDVLHLAAVSEPRGTGGAILGYPEGGPLTTGRAAVRQAIIAVGRDIYGRGTVRRDVYELQARVHPGNSGGPFVLPDGQVAGVVFAASTTDDRIGYAIASTEVVPDLDRAFATSSATSTGDCVR